MPTSASTLRLDPDVQTELNHLSKALRRPKNRLINEAVKLYVAQRSQELEQELEATLAALRAYRRKHPNDEASGESFVREEARFGGNDPVEGRTVGSPGAVRTEIRHLLHA